MDTKHGIIRLITVLSVSLALLAVMTAGVWAEEEEIFIETPEPVVEESVEYSIPGSDSENDEMLWGYLESSLQKQLNPAPMMLKAKRPSSAQGNDQIVLSNLKDAVSEIAAGNRESTIISIPLSAFGIDSLVITEDELNLKSGTILSYDENGEPIVENGNLVINNEAYQEGLSIVKSKIEYSSHNVLSMLLSECPYEMYWANKEISNHPKNAQSEMKFSFSVGYDSEKEKYVSKFTYSQDHISVYLTPAPNYAGTETYTVDNTKTSAASNAIITANTIIQSAKNIESDYEKLLYYKNEICRLVSYDYEAAEHLNDETYPNAAWQMINVFDDDEEDNTKAVCEGYSKAFQYLCDHTTFNNPEIYCFCPTGTMYGGTGAGPHMWNIVKFGENEFYLVDVTNCDTGSVGATDYLFIKGYETHQYETVKIEEDEETTREISGKWYTYDCNGTKIKYLYDGDLIFSPAELSVADNSAVVSHQLSLGGKIGVIFNLNKNINISVDENSISATIDDSEISYVYSNKRITVYINSIQMAEPITLTFSYTKGTDTTVYSYNGQYSAMEYINSYYALPDDQKDETTENLVTALHKYGYYIRLFLEEVHGEAAYSSYEEMDSIDPPVTNIDPNYFPYNPIVWGLADSGITASYLLRFDSGTDIQVTLSGEIDSVDVNGEEYQGDFHKIIIPSILPQELDSVYGIDAWTTSGGASIEISALSYIWSVLKSDKYKDDEVAKYAMQALFDYYKATNLYIDPEWTGNY
ncbi:MAG: hypothetical protein K6D94_07145 [Clostridiales bacterium]|nr:hypothetical protein [Clostridiales bacterium]